MEIIFSLREMDLLALAKYQVDTSEIVKRRAKSRRFIYPIAFFAVGLGDLILSGEIVLPSLFFLISIFSYLLFPIYFQWLSKRNIKRIVHERMTPSSIGSRTLRITPEGLEQIMENAESKVKWSLIDKVDITPSYTYIAIAGTYSVIIPRDQINESEYEEFVAKVREYCSLDR